MPTEPLAVAVHLGQLQVVGEEVDRCAMAWAQENAKIEKVEMGKGASRAPLPNTSCGSSMFSSGPKGAPVNTR